VNSISYHTFTHTSSKKENDRMDESPGVQRRLMMFLARDVSLQV
jgi:hypothetical protein